MTDKSILLVDDNEHDVFLTRRALKKSNIVNELMVASAGQEALDYLFGAGKFEGRDLSRMPVVTLLDVNMPKMNGFEVLKEIRSNPRTKLLPVVILTASKEDIDIARGYTEGCNCYVVKPVDFSQFAEAIRELGLFWLLTNEAAPVA